MKMHLVNYKYVTDLLILAKTFRSWPIVNDFIVLFLFPNFPLQFENKSD